MKVIYTQDDIARLIVADIEKRMGLVPSCVPVDIGLVQIEGDEQVAMSVNLNKFHEVPKNVP